MMKLPRICICGGGNIAHSLAAVLSERESVSVFTRSPARWANVLSYDVGQSNTKRWCCCTLNPTDDLRVVAEAECVFVCLPRFAIDSLLSRIDPVLHAGQVVAFVPAPAGMEAVVERNLSKGVDTIGFQRVPYISRIREYGHAVWISDVRSVSKLAFSRPEIADHWSSFVEKRIGGHVEKLSSFLSFTFSNSNPLLHPSRIVTLLRGGKNGVYTACPYFYAEWTDESSYFYVDADREMYEVFCAYSAESAATDYESALVHYESRTPEEITRKIRSIESLRPILAPWVKNEAGLWEPDYESRYFREDIPYGTRVIKRYAEEKGICTPTIDYLIEAVMRARG